MTLTPAGQVVLFFIVFGVISLGVLLTLFFLFKK